MKICSAIFQIAYRTGSSIYTGAVMDKRTEQGATKRKLIYIGSGIALGAGLGLIASLLFFDNLALSLIFGAAVGLVIGALIDWQASQKRESQ
jgi:uncharacterized membrane protein